MDNLFYELIRVSIGTQERLSRLPNEAEWTELYDFAVKQSLVGVCFAGLQALGADADEGFIQIGMSEGLYLSWMGMAAQINIKNEVVNKQCRDLASRFKSDGIDYCLMKGQQVGRYYGELAMLRQSGDIDIWMKGGMKKVVEYVKKIAPTRSMSHQHVHLNVYKDTSVEMHYLPAELHCPWYDKHLKCYLETNSSFVEIDDDSYLNGVSVPSDEFNIMHLLSHSFRHLLGEGITLRQLLDLYFVMKSWKPSEKVREDLLNTIELCGLKTFFESTMYVMHKIFCLSDAMIMSHLDSVGGEQLLSEIMFDYADTTSTRKRESAWGRFIRVTKKNSGLYWIAPMEVVWTPIWRICNWLWMKIHGYTYH